MNISVGVSVLVTLVDMNPVRRRQLGNVHCKLMSVNYPALALAERRGNVFCLPEGYMYRKSPRSDDLER